MGFAEVRAQWRRVAATDHPWDGEYEDGTFSSPRHKTGLGYVIQNDEDGDGFVWGLYSGTQMTQVTSGRADSLDEARADAEAAASQGGKTAAIGDQDPDYKAACALVRDWQNGLIGVDDVTANLLERTHGDEVRTRTLMRDAVEWWHYMQSFKDQFGDPIPRTGAREGLQEISGESAGFAPTSDVRALATTAALTDAYKDWGEDGNKSHITLEERGTIPTKLLAHMNGLRGETPGAHRNRQGQAWEDFKDDIKANGIKNPIFITVDWNEEPGISEGNHRRDAALELGLPEVPVEIRYFGNADKQGRVLERLQRTATKPQS